ncbi:MAG: hypothetical protein KDA61_17510, partial [Planctomycetales bacterium]|nr:hypothetical protein [Planctomycetales bacterium]
MMPRPRLSLFAASMLALLAPCSLAVAETVGGADHAAWRDDAALHDVCFIDAEQGWAVGDHGAIWHSADGGATWEAQESGSSATLHGVSFVDSQIGFCVGTLADGSTSDGQSQGVVLATTNGGQAWNTLSAVVPGLHRVKFFNRREGIAVGRGSPARTGGVYVTTSAGQGWQPLGSGSRQTWLAADFVTLSQGAMAGVGGIAGTLQDGRYAVPPAIDLAGRTLRDLALQPPINGWLVGDGGLALTTSDLGAHWQVVASLPPKLSDDFDFYGVAVSDAHVWLA